MDRSLNIPKPLNYSMPSFPFLESLQVLVFVVVVLLQGILKSISLSSAIYR